VACGGTMWRWPLEVRSVEGGGTGVQQTAQGGCMGTCGAVRRLVGGSKVGRQELAVGASMADRGVRPARGTAGGPYSWAAPCLRIEVREHHSMTTRLGLRACRRPATDRGVTRGGYGAIRQEQSGTHP
jgi:hypothetical protein